MARSGEKRMAMSSNWKDRIQDGVDSIPEAKRPTESKRIGLHFQPDWYKIVELAAASRGMSKGAYVRRAAMAFAIYDLQMRYEDVMKDEPPIRDNPNESRPFRARHGNGFGLWKIMGLGR
jgi:hypothetical protein